MKKILRILPALIVIAAASLCLSFDNNGKLVLLGSGEEQQELLVVTTPPPNTWKQVFDRCPDGTMSRDCQTGGSLQCERLTCSPN